MKATGVLVLLSLLKSMGVLKGFSLFLLQICKEFTNRSVYCTRESNPHCGTDGVTYGNRCAFCKAVLKSGGKIRLKHLGKC
uniref:Serine peptidase inhibitor, Kazal type 6 n=1 Tax=Apteryx owenii TaxID=8824 RepID=A0A8B9PTT2_APTOW